MTCHMFDNNKININTSSTLITLIKMDQNLFNDDGTVSSNELVERIMISAEIQQLQVQNKKLKIENKQLKEQNEKLLESISKSEAECKVKEAIEKRNEELLEKVSKLETKCNKSEEIIQFLRTEEVKINQTKYKLETEQTNLEKMISILLEKLNRIKFPVN